ncbi:MAG TPA: ATP-binding cassette domain-containing protein [Candidatus Latescibacteria bacterium]|nr:ATP-binding cassette domain-containing protein [Candidatus Latescibacterota bacterium]
MQGVPHRAVPVGSTNDRVAAAPRTNGHDNGKALIVHGARENNLQDLTVEFPLGSFIAVTGASGSGKSTLVSDILYKRLWKELVDTRTLAGDHDAVDGIDHVTRVIAIDQSPIGRNSRSNPATYIGFYDNIRSLFAATDAAQSRGYKPGRFSFNVKGGRCEECQGEGSIRTKMYFMPDVEVLCAACKGKRYNADTLQVMWNDRTIADILDMSIEEGAEFFSGEKAIGPKVAILDDLGLGYLTLGQSATTLSGGEAQRIKLATELSKLQRRGHVLYILDEPTTGLHLADISRLLDCLHRLVAAGHTVIVIEHHLDVIKTADHVIDLGPEGGRGGGRVLVEGTPKDVARCKASHTGRFLKQMV